jgi:hypothetical protein
MHILDRSIMEFGSYPLFISNLLSVLGIFVIEDSIFGDLYFVWNLIHSRWLASYVLASLVAKVAAFSKAAYMMILMTV